MIIHIESYPVFYTIHFCSVCELRESTTGTPPPLLNTPKTKMMMKQLTKNMSTFSNDQNTDKLINEEPC